MKRRSTGKKREARGWRQEGLGHESYHGLKVSRKATGSFWGVVIGFCLFSICFFAVGAARLSATAATAGKNSEVSISKASRAAGANVRSLPGALQSLLSERLGSNDPRYRVTGSGGRYRAVNSRNRLRATMGQNGFRVRAGAGEWGLRLTAWGRGRSLHGIEAGRAVSGSNRVQVDRGGITEWWINGPLGIEQGWTVTDRPHPGNTRGQLTLFLRQSGDLRAQAVSRGNSLSVSGKAGREVLRYTGLTAYDKNGRQLPAHFEATGKEVRVVVDVTGAAYPVRIDPWIQAAKLTGSNAEQLGYSVAVSQDGATVVAGSSGATVGINDQQGAVYIFKEPASGWANAAQTAKLTASDGAAGDQLGSSVAVSSDGTTVLAGAPGRNGGEGAAYVFKEPASGWANGTQAAELTASVGADGTGLGNSVAVSSDGTIVAVGAPQATSGSISAGAVYLFEEPASGWASGTESALLTASHGSNGDYLGWSVALSPNGATVVAAAPDATIGGNRAQGAVYVFKEPASGWANSNETAQLTVSSGASGDVLGNSVAVSSEGAIVVAGAPGVTVGGNYSEGAVYLFEEPASGWANSNETATLTSSVGAGVNELGLSVAVSSDGKTVAAGVGLYNAQGAVFVFDEPASGWASGTESAKLTASDGTANNGLGFSVALSPDGGTIVAGAPEAAAGSSGSQEGAVYVFGGPFWQNAPPTGGGWYYLSPFGAFNTNSFPWIYHQTLGWLFPIAISTNSIWFYDPQWDGTGGWWWTSVSFFPWIFSVNDNQWLYYDAKDSNPGARWFFSGTGQASTH